MKILRLLAIDALDSPITLYSVLCCQHNVCDRCSTIVSCDIDFIYMQET